MLKATLIELDLIDVPFPSGFKPCFYAGHDTHNEGVCWWHVFNSKPKWQDGFWVSDGDSYEIGSYEEDDGEPPSIIADLSPENSLIKIILRV